jgi:hypothetical protein
MTTSTTLLRFIRLIGRDLWAVITSEISQFILFMLVIVGGIVSLFLIHWVFVAFIWTILGTVAVGVLMAVIALVLVVCDYVRARWKESRS